MPSSTPMRQQIWKVRVVIHLRPQAKNMTVTKTPVAELTPTWQREVTIAYSELQKYPTNVSVPDTWLQTEGRTVDCVWNVMAHAQKPDFVFRRNGRVNLSRRGRPFSRLLAAEVCASAEVMLDTPCSEVVWRVLATHSIRQFPLHFPSCASPCAMTFQLESNMESDVYWTVHHCDNWRIKNQLDATYHFIVRLIGSTCFGHYYAHHQELATMLLIKTLVVSLGAAGWSSVGEMGIVMPETFWAYKKYNKIISGIYRVTHGNLTSLK